MPVTWYPVPTPAANSATTPTAGELAVFKVGFARFPNIGDFMVFEHAKNTNYNCFAWSLGFQDRWLEGGTRAEMVRLCGCPDSRSRFTPIQAT